MPVHSIEGHGTHGGAADFYITGRYYSGYSGITTTGTIGAEIHLVPIEIHAESVFDQIAVQVVTAGAGAGSVTRLGLYTDGAGTWTLLQDAGTIDPLSTGLKTAVIAQTLPPGVIWAAVNQQTAGGGTAPSFVRRQATMWSPFIGMTDPVLSSGNLPRNGYRTATANTTTLPATIALADTVIVDTAPMVHLRAA